MKYWKTEHFKALQQDWYRRLEESGFSDQEILDNGELKLKDIRPYKTVTAEQKAEKEKYFNSLAECIHTHDFECEAHRLVMVLKANGYRIKDICERLRQRFKPSITAERLRKNVRFIIRKYEMKWGLRTYIKNSKGDLLKRA